MNNKHLTVIVFTIVLSISIAATVGSAVIDKKINTVQTVDTKDSASQTKDTEKGNSEVIDSTTTLSDHHSAGNAYFDIIDQILDANTHYETVLSPSNIGGKNPSSTDVAIDVDGETMTTVYETETTTIEEETTISPETSSEVTTVKEQEVIPDTPEIADTTTEPVADTTTIESQTETILETETTIVQSSEETTGSTEIEQSTEPIDNSQSEAEL